jgi:hypothetical protein
MFLNINRVIDLWLGRTKAPVQRIRIITRLT